MSKPCMNVICAVAAHDLGPCQVLLSLLLKQKNVYQVVVHESMILFIKIGLDLATLSSP
jgi:hypothetical protein